MALYRQYKHIQFMNAHQSDSKCNGLSNLLKKRYILKTLFTPIVAFLVLKNKEHLLLVLHEFHP